MDNNICDQSKKENEEGIITLKVINKNINKYNVISNTNYNISTPSNDSNIINIISPIKKLRLVIVDEINYEDNILFFNSIINEAKNFLDSVSEMQKMIPPIKIYKKGSRYNYDTLINRSREKFGIIFDYSLTNPESITCNTSKVTIRCMICTYKQTTSSDTHLKGKGCGNCGNICLWYYEIFIYFSFLIHGNKYIYPIIERDKRITLNEHFDIVCKKYKHVWSTTINHHIHSKSGCPICSIEERTYWNYDKLMEAVVRVHCYKYNYSKVIPSEINSCYSKFTVICNTCDYEWSPDVAHHINKGSGCPLCAGNAPWSYERFLIAAFKINKNDTYYGLIKPEDIQGAYSRIELVCRKCDYHWNTTISIHIHSGSGCPSCAKKKPWTYIKFIKSAQIIHGNKYSYELVNPDDIKEPKSIINIICLKCKYQWSSSIHCHINNKYNCPRCMQCLAHSLETLTIKIIEIHGDNINYSLVKQEHIRNNRSHVPLICNKCKKCWSPTISSLVNKKSGCPRCKISKGERACLNYLLSNNILFEEQFKILELGMKRFDFMVEHNGLKYVIEFDGIQHFKFTEYFYKSVNVFIERQEVDILKTSIALKNGYNIIRIDYKQIKNVNFHISEALNLKNKTYFSTPELYTHIIRKLEKI